MCKWDPKPTWRLGVLEGKATAKTHSPRTITVPMSVEPNGRLDYTFDPDKETSVLQLQKSSRNCF